MAMPDLQALPMFIILKSAYFQLWFLHKVADSLLISITGKHQELSNSYTFNPRKTDNIFHIIDKIKVSRV